MKHTNADRLLLREMLCFVRDHAPTADDFTARYGGPGGQAYHLLRKAGAIVVEGGRVRLGRQHLSSDGQSFVWGNLVFRLDRDEIMVVRREPSGSPTNGPNAEPSASGESPD